MIDLITESERLLSGAGYSAWIRKNGVRDIVLFEGTTVLGFVFGYETVAELLRSWAEDAKTAIATNQLGLRRAQIKAWNAYTIFLGKDKADFAQTVMLGTIEEDLAATRKIARAGVSSTEDLHAALLALLPIQSAPRLEAVDMAAEVRLRTTELPNRVVQAFLSDASETLVAKLIEEEP
jgi:hypothetical protein